MNQSTALNSRAQVLIEGRVQGVFFRAYARDQAAQLKLTGWVRNLPDGRVEAVVEGGSAQVESFVNWCRTGPVSAKVTGITLEKQEYQGEFQTFSVR